MSDRRRQVHEAPCRRRGQRAPVTLREGFVPRAQRTGQHFRERHGGDDQFVVAGLGTFEEGCVAWRELAMAFEEVDDGSAVDQDPAARRQLAYVCQGHSSRSSPTNRAASP